MMVLTAVHDAMVKPMPGKPFAPSLAESWTLSKDGLVYEFVVRKGVVFHNGDALTAEDVKFSFERYKGAADSSYGSVAEAIGNQLGAVGIRTKLRPMERAAFLGNWKDKKITSIMYSGAGGQGNAATRIQNYLLKEGLYSFGGYPDMDDLFVQQARELDPKRRAALLHQIQRLAHERVMAAPLWELGFLNGVGPRVEESGLGLIALHPYSAPYEDIKLKN